MILQLIRLLFLQLYSFHDIEILSDFLLMPDSFLVFTHQSV